MPSASSPLANVEALAFDIFGTVVDWRSSVTDELTLRGFRKSSAEIPRDLRERLDSMTEGDWARFAQEWRSSYHYLCHSFDPSRDAWKTIDQHHCESLVELLGNWDLAGLFSDSEITSLSLVWHRLNPWPDSPLGIEKLGETYVTATLSNGNGNLLRDLNDFGALGFQKLLSAEMFEAYKPSPIVYNGAVRRLGLEPGKVAMVAAHLGDLHAARECGLRTIYVERPGEESWSKDDDKYKEARDWVDLWVSEEEDGLLTVVKKLSELQ
ncbi:hypothetical protein PT974_05813 [Cladobotryum mycophilum]|uniref:Haloacid dehalogenase n=1 Tax=Cladobotryum mycophilum TaxID=491253 RepID=A0ABR0SJT9_9HYPO